MSLRSAQILSLWEWLICCSGIPQHKLIVSCQVRKALWLAESQLTSVGKRAGKSFGNTLLKAFMYYALQRVIKGYNAL